MPILSFGADFPQEFREATLQAAERLSMRTEFRGPIAFTIDVGDALGAYRLGLTSMEILAAPRRRFQPERPLIVRTEVPCLNP